MATIVMSVDKVIDAALSVREHTANYIKRKIPSNLGFLLDFRTTSHEYAQVDSKKAKNLWRLATYGDLSPLIKRM